MRSKKRNAAICLIAAGCLAGILIWQHTKPNGSTTESREELLNAALSKGEDWTIVRETEVEEHLVCGACSADNRAAIVVFEPSGNGKYVFSTATCGDRKAVLFGGAVLNGDWYDLAWFCGEQTEYAEILYSVGGAAEPALRYDTSNMEVLYHRNPKKEYSVRVCYYDAVGGQYTWPA